MSQSMRFGRRIALPSTRQIRHELLMMMQEEQRLMTGKLPGTTSKAAPSALVNEPLQAAV